MLRRSNRIKNYKKMANNQITMGFDEEINNQMGIESEMDRAIGINNSESNTNEGNNSGESENLKVYGTPTVGLNELIEILNKKFDESNKNAEILKTSIDKKFEESSKNAEALNKKNFEEINKNAEALNKRFDESDKKFEEINKNAEILKARLDKKFAEQNKKLEENNKKLEELSGNVSQNAETMDRKFNEFAERFENKLEEIKLRSDTTAETIRTEMNDKLNKIEENFTDKLGNKCEDLRENLKEIASKVVEVEKDVQESIKEIEITVNKNLTENQNNVDAQIDKVKESQARSNNKILEIESQCQENSQKINQYQKQTDEMKNKVTEVDERLSNLKTRDGIIIREPEIRDISFTGKERFPMQFLRIIKEVSVSYTHQGNMYWLDRYLKDEACVWWFLHRREVKNFEDFEKIFMDKYFNEMIQANIRDRLEFGKFKGKIGDEAITYVENMMLECSELEPPILEAQLVQKIAKHFHPTTLIAVITRGVKTKQEFVKLLMEFRQADVRHINSYEERNGNYKASYPRDEREGEVVNRPWGQMNGYNSRHLPLRQNRDVYRKPDVRADIKNGPGNRWEGRQPADRDGRGQK